MELFDRIANNFSEFLEVRLENSGITIADIIPRQDTAAWFREFLAENIPEEISLSGVEPDFERIYLALQQRVTNNESWRDINVAGTGSMLLSLIAAGITYNQTAIIRAAQESTLDTARLPNSIYALTRMLGVRITRKSPSSVRVSLNNSNFVVPQVVPAFTRWSVNQDIFFNRNIIIFREGEAALTDIRLFQGNIVQEEFRSDGSTNQRYEVGINDFSTSDQDLRVFVNNVEWLRTEDGLWSHGKENVFQELTLAKGNVEVRFGNGIFGNTPDVGSTISIQYARTLGSDGLDHNSNEEVTSQNNSNISGITTSRSSTGGNQEEPEFYRVNAPFIHSGRSKAVTRQQYKSLIMTYPGVLDAEVMGQQHINPDDPTLFNRVLITALLRRGEQWTNEEWSDFRTWLEERSMIGVQLERNDPSAVFFDINATVFCVPNTNLQSTNLAIRSFLTETFSIRNGSLGRDVFRNDVHRALITEPSSRNNVTHAILDNPLNDIIISNSSFVQLRSINLKVEYGNRIR